MALRRDDVWTRRVVRMVGVSTAAHVAIFGSLALFGAWLAASRPAPIIAYSVELTDFPGTGGRLPGGPGKDLIGRSASAGGGPAPKPVAPPAAKAPVPKAHVKPAPSKPSTPPVQVKPVPPKVATKKPEAKAAPSPAKTVETKPTAPVAAAETPPAPAAPVVNPPPADDYASAAQRFRDRVAETGAGSGAGAPGAGVAGGGPGGGVLGSGGDGRGGGQLKSLEWIAYRQRIVNTVKERWSNAIKRPGLLTTVRFRIAPDGTISDVRIARASGNSIYDQTAVGAVERVGQLPPPPPAHAAEFADFEINFHGEETGGVS
jgi:TonB family protein